MGPKPRDSVLWLVALAPAAALALCAGCLSAPPSGEDVGEPPALGNTQFRTIGDPGNLFVVDVQLVDERRLTTSPDVSADLVPGQRLQLGSEFITHIRAIDGNEIIIEDDFSEGTITIRHPYTTLAQWIADRARSLVDDDSSEAAVVMVAQMLDQPVNVTGFTTDAAHTVTIMALPELAHSGSEESGIVIRGSNNADCLVIDQDFATISSLRFANCGQGNSHAAIQLVSGRLLVDRVMITDFGDGTKLVNGIRNGGGTLNVRNTIVADGDRGIHTSETGVSVIENVTIFRMGHTGVSIGNTGTASATNSIVFSTESAFASGAVVTSSLSAEEDNGVAIATPEELFADTNSDRPDLHLSATASAALGQGNNLSDRFSHDIDGDTRGDAWDIGADQR